MAGLFEQLVVGSEREAGIALRNDALGSGMDREPDGARDGNMPEAAPVAKGIRVTMATAHPAIIRRCDHSSLWGTIHVNRYGNRHHGGADKGKTGHLKPPAVSAMRPVVMLGNRP